MILSFLPMTTRGHAAPAGPYGRIRLQAASRSRKIFKHLCGTLPAILYNRSPLFYNGKRRHGRQKEVPMPNNEKNSSMTEELADMIAEKDLSREKEPVPENVVPFEKKPEPEEEPVPDDAEDEEEDRHNKYWPLIKIVISGYLIYLAVTMIMQMRKEGDGKWYFYMFSILFIVSAFFFIATTLHETFSKGIAAGKEREKQWAEEARRAALSGGKDEEPAPEQKKTSAPLPVMKTEPAKSTDIMERLRQINRSDGVEMEMLPDEKDAEEASEASGSEEDPS